jgi:hypothetical protein
MSRAILLPLLLSLLACSTRRDRHDEYVQLRRNAEKRDVFGATIDVARALRDDCSRPDSDQSWELEFSHKDHVLKQADGIHGYVKLLCFEVTPDFPGTLRILASQQGKKGKELYLLVPRVSFYDRDMARIKLAPRSTRFDERVNGLVLEFNLGSSLRAGIHYMVLEVDNREARLAPVRGLSERLVLRPFPIGALRAELNP